jgi:hypothetical protein
MEDRRREMMSGESFEAVEKLLERATPDRARFESALRRARMHAYLNAARDLVLSKVPRLGARQRLS